MAMFEGIKYMVLELLILNICVPVMFITICKLLIYEEKIDIFQISVLYFRFVFVVLSSQCHPFNFGDHFPIKKNFFVYGIVMPSLCVFNYLCPNYIEKETEEGERFVDYFDIVFFYLGLDVTNKCVNGSIRRWYIQMRYGFQKIIFNLILLIAFLYLSYLLKGCVSSLTGGLVIKSKEYNSPPTLVNEYKESQNIFDTSQDALRKPKYKQRAIAHHKTYQELFYETSPASEIQYHRFPGEDIKFKCEWTLAKHKISNLKVAVSFTKWTMIGLKNMEYDVHYRRYIESTKKYQTDSFSRIFITSEHFGVYYLWHSEMHADVMHTHLVCRFELKKAKVVTEYIQVPVGSFLILGNHIFHTFANISDLTVVYMVQSVALGRINLTSNEIYSECSYWTNAYKHYRKNNYGTLSITSWEHTVTVNGGTCVSSKLYGIHHLSIVRKKFKETLSNRRSIGVEEIMLRHRYLVHPGPTFLNFLYKSQQFSENNLPSVSDIIDEERLWTIRQGIEGTLILFLLFFLITGCLLAPKLCNYLFDLSSALMNLFSKVNKVKVEHFSDFINDIEFFKEIDCLLISAENERQYNILISSCLEGEKLKVCIPDRDFDVNGLSFKLYSQATRTALSVVIICSTDLVQDSFLNTYVITDMILNRLKDKSIKETNILIIKTDIQNLPTSLQKI